MNNRTKISFLFYLCTLFMCLLCAFVGPSNAQVDDELVGISANYTFGLFRVKCGKGVSYKNAAMTRIRKCSKFRNPKARRLMSLILLLMPSTMPLVVR